MSLSRNLTGSLHLLVEATELERARLFSLPWPVQYPPTTPQPSLDHSGHLLEDLDASNLAQEPILLHGGTDSFETSSEPSPLTPLESPESSQTSLDPDSESTHSEEPLTRSRTSAYDDAEYQVASSDEDEEDDYRPITRSSSKSIQNSKRSKGHIQKVNNKQKVEVYRRTSIRRRGTKERKVSERWYCDIPGCGKSVGREADLKRHKELHSGLRNKCEVKDCGLTWLQFSNYATHWHSQHGVDNISDCWVCGAHIPDFAERTKHQTTEHPDEFRVFATLNSWRSRSASIGSTSSVSSPRSSVISEGWVDLRSENGHGNSYENDHKTADEEIFRHSENDHFRKASSAPSLSDDDYDLVDDEHFPPSSYTNCQGNPAAVRWGSVPPSPVPPFRYEDHGEYRRYEGSSYSGASYTYPPAPQPYAHTYPPPPLGSFDNSTRGFIHRGYHGHGYHNYPPCSYPSPPAPYPSYAPHNPCPSQGSYDTHGRPGPIYTEPYTAPRH